MGTGDIIIAGNPAMDRHQSGESAVVRHALYFKKNLDILGELRNGSLEISKGAVYSLKEI